MTTHTNAGVVGHTTDAEFRAWIQEFEAAMVAIGLVVTSDTGQLVLASALRPATNVYAGYRIYKTNDGLADLYIKVEFGTSASSATTGIITIQIGWGTNGAGTLNAAGASTRTTISASNTITSTVTSYTTRACGITGCWWIAFKLASCNGSTQAFAGFALMRFADATGAPTSDGFVWYYPATNSAAFTAQQVRASGPFVSAVSSNFCLLPADVTSPVVGTDIQFWKHFTAQPRARCNPFAVTCDATVAVENTQRSLTPVGAATHNFISNGTTYLKTAGVGAASANHIALLPWE